MNDAIEDIKNFVQRQLDLAPEPKEEGAWSQFRWGQRTALMMVQGFIEGRTGTPGMCGTGHGTTFSLCGHSYRSLLPGEQIKEGDEVWEDGPGQWHPVHYSLGATYGDYMRPVRRPVAK